MYTTAMARHRSTSVKVIQYYLFFFDRNLHEMLGCPGRLDTTEHWQQASTLASEPAQISIRETRSPQHRSDLSAGLATGGLPGNAG